MRELESIFINEQVSDYITTMKSLLRSLLELITGDSKKHQRRRAKISRWYQYPFIPRWASNFGTPQNTIGDRIYDLNLNKGTLYRIITKGKYYKIVIKKKRYRR